MLVNTAHPIIPARSVEGMYFQSSPYHPISLSDSETRGKVGKVFVYHYRSF